MLRTKLALWMTLGLAAACGGDAGGGGGGGDGGDGPDASADAAPDEPLTCRSAALCTTYEVKTFTGTVPPAAGGEIRSGLYRLSYSLIPDDVGEQPGYQDDLDVLLVSGASFNWAGFFRDYVGTISTSGTVATFQQTRYCLRGDDGDPSTTAIELPYTATPTELHLYSRVRRSDGVEWDKMSVYVLASDPADVCRTVASEPGSPGDSVRCNVTTCACSFALDGTVDECT